MWSCTAPTSWPDPPTEITASGAASAEACPRRWALGAADYPELWPRRGYPPRVQIASLAGSVVHRSVEVVVRELARAGCHSMLDPTTSGVLRRLGGWSRIVNGAIDEVTAFLAGNPRAASLIESATRTLRSQVPEYRLRVQELLSRVHLHSGGGNARLREAGAPSGRLPLSPGTYSELELRASRIGWRGRVDFLSLTDTDCEITDFKSGEYSDAHESQILIYACLWHLDQDLNPSARRATRLVLRYPARDIEVPAPSGERLLQLEEELAARSLNLRSALSERPPEARASATNCGYCGVRHLCEVFWSGGLQRAIEAPSTDADLVDVEATVDSRHGPTSWDVTVRSSQPRLVGSPAVLRAGTDLRLPVGATIRVLGATVIQDPSEEHVPLISIGILGEIFAVEPTRAGDEDPSAVSWPRSRHS